MAGRNGFLYTFTPHNESFIKTRIGHKSSIVRIIPYNADKLIIQAGKEGLYIYDMNNEEVFHYNDSRQFILSNNISAIHIEKDDIWLTYNNNPLVTRFNFHTKDYKHYELKKQENKINKRFFFRDSNGYLWVNSREDALNYYDTRRDEFRVLEINKNEDKRKLIKVSRTLSDKQGNLWICEQEEGLIKVSFKKEYFNTLSIGKKEQYIWGENIARSVFEDADSNIWVGTRHDGIQVFDHNRKFKGFLNRNGEITREKDNISAAYSFIQDKERNIWIGTKDMGLIRLEPEAKDKYKFTQFKHHKNQPYSINSNSVYSLLIDKNDRLWIGTFGGGLNYIVNDRDGLRFINSKNILNNYPIEKCSKIRDMHIDEDNNIWVATSNGILRCSQTDGTISYEHITKVPGDINSLSSNNVYGIIENNYKELYFATFGGGISKMTRKENGELRFDHFNKKNGLTDIPLNICKDKDGIFWISSEEGIYRFDTDADSIERYDNRFLPSNTIFMESDPICATNGDMLFCTNKGVLYFSPYNLNKSDYCSPLVLTELYINGKNIPVTNKDIDKIDKFSFSHNENSFAFDFRALDMRFSDKIEYAYRLEGFDDWNFVGNNCKAVYTNVPKGKYKLHIKSTNSEGVWSNVREYDIVVRPSFWESVYGIILYIFVGLLVIAITSYVLLVIYKLRNRVAIESEIMRMKSKFFADIIHEMRTPFTLIISPIEHLLAQSDLNKNVRDNLELIKRNTRHTLRLINQVLDLQKIQNDKMKLSVQRIELNGFIKYIADSFHSIAIQRETEFKISSSGKEVFVWADADKLESIMFNLIGNSFKYSPKGTTITVAIIENDYDITINVTDQGYGISAEKQKSIFNRFENYINADLFKQQSTGIGLSLVKELVELHKGTISLHSKVDEGSSFTISLNKDKMHFGPETEFIISDFKSESTTENNAFDKNDYKLEEMNKDNSKNTILVVEDNDELRNFLYSVFSDEFRTIIAENGETGFEKALQYQPDMIVTDLVMPQMDGIEMVKKLQDNADTCHIPIVMMSSKDSVESRNEGFELGIEDYIVKPFSANTLKIRIQNIIQKRKKFQSLYYGKLVANNDKEKQVQENELIPGTSLSGMTKADIELLEKVISFIDANLDNTNLGVDDVAGHIGISRSLLFKKLKALIDTSPMELIKSKRITRASELIYEGSYNFTQIAYMTGFNDSQYFSKCFKQVHGITPTEYKNGKMM